MIESPRTIRRRRRSLWIRRAILAVTFGLLVDAIVGDRGLFAVRRARLTESRTAAQLAGLAAENASLRSTIQSLTSDPRAIEFVARGELSLLRPDEILFVVHDLTQK